MKKKIFQLILTACLALFISGAIFAQNPPPPPGDPGGGGGNPPVGGGTPVGSGMVTLIALAAFYGAGKTYQLTKYKKAR
ncbi:MAG: hypothetical protein IH598_15430 [Bacteroidales bacterium]|nr:hypothetical protein [Bacteroidales bacterium]